MENFKEIEELKQEFTQAREGDKFYHKQVFKDDRIYIYQVNNNWFEVFKRTIRPKSAYQDGKFVKLEGVGKATYPSNNNFGFWAWNCHDKKVIEKVLSRNLNYSTEEINSILSQF